MSLGSLIKIVKSDGYKLLDLIEESYKSQRVQDPLYEDDWFRISSMGMICEREEILCSRYNLTRSEEIKSDAGVNFEHGHAVHSMFQNRVLANINAIIGCWRCTYCGTVYGEKHCMVPRPERCIRCGAVSGDRPRMGGVPDLSVDDHAFTYVEQWIGNFEHRIGGSPDGFLMQNYRPDYVPSDLTVVEIKSCNDKNYKNYKDAPDFVHVLQTQMYMWLSGSQRTKILYFNKNGGKDSIAEHDVEFDEESVHLVLNGLKVIREGIATGALPPRTVCQDYNCGRAYRCKARDLCFKD